MENSCYEYKWDCFIAYAASDKNVAEHLYDILHGDFRVFLDARSLQLGDDWDLRLREAQQSSLITVVLISANTERAYYQREEIAAAIDLARTGTGRRVVPVYLNTEAALGLNSVWVGVETRDYVIRLCWPWGASQGAS